MSRSAIAIGWAAGFFDGEGSIGIYRTGARSRDRLFLRVVNTDATAIHAFQSIVGRGNVSHQRRNPSSRRQHFTLWRCTRREDCAAVLRLIGPHLVVKDGHYRLLADFIDGDFSGLPGIKVTLNSLNSARRPAAGARSVRK